MCTRLFLEPNIEVDVTTRPRADVTAQVDLDTETLHGHWKTTADRDRRTCGATTQEKRWQGRAVHSPVSSLHAHVRSLSTACGHSQESGALPGSRMQQSHNPRHLDYGDSFSTFIPLCKREVKGEDRGLLKRVMSLSPSSSNTVTPRRRSSFPARGCLSS